MRNTPSSLDYESAAPPIGRVTRLLRTVSMPVCFAALMVPLGLLCYAGDAGFRPVLAVISGHAFGNRPLVFGGALDQPSLHKEAFIFCFSVAMLCPFLVLARTVGRYCPRAARLAVAITSLVILLHPLSILTIFTYDVARYVHKMGWTEARLRGLVCAAIAYVVLGAFALWIARLVRRGTQCQALSQSHGSCCT